MKTGRIPEGDLAKGWSGKVRKHPDAALLFGLFCSTLVLHILASARTVTFSDSGDFLMAIHTVGNCHGPGYPLFLMSAKLFSWVVPLGSLAFRASLFSGLFASITACLIYWIIWRLVHSRAGGVVGALAFAFSYTFWYQTVIPETYSLNTFFMALLIILMLRWERVLKEGRVVSADNTLCLFALVYGLALTNHYSILFLLPAFLFYAVATDWRAVVAPRNLLRMGAFFLLGLLPYLYVPAAAFRGPAYNYGDPSTLTRWIRHVTLYYERGGLFNYPLKLYLSRVLRYPGTLSTEFPYFAWLGAVGIVYSFLRRRSKQAVFLLLMFFFSLLTVMTYLQTESVLRAHFYYPSYLIFSLWIGMGAAFFVKLPEKVRKLERAKRRVASLVIAVVLCLAVGVSAAGIHYAKIDKSRYLYAEELARNILKTGLPGSIVMVDEDNIYFPCRYLQVVEGVRPDIRLILPSATGAFGFQGKDLLLRISPDAKSKPGASNYVNIVERNLRDEPVYTTIQTYGNFDWKVAWLGYLLRLFSGEENVKVDAVVGKTAASPVAMSGDIDTDAREAVLYPSALEALRDFGSKEYEPAAKIYRSIIGSFARNIYVPTLYSCATYSDLYANLGQVLNQLGDYRQTVAILPRADSIDPYFTSLTLAHAYAETGNKEAAISELNDYLTVFPTNETGLIARGQTYSDLGQYRNAARDFETVIALDSSNPQAHFLYGLTLVRLRRPKEAAQQFRAVVTIDPAGDWASLARSELDRLGENKK